MNYYGSGAEFASDTGIPLANLEDTHEAHFQAARSTERDPDNGPWNGYPAGKSWDRASGLSGKGKRFFKNCIPGSQVCTEPFYVAIITPVLHYCMGGLEVDTNAAVLGTRGSPIAGLWAVGEVMGGVHGNNRLGGNSLLDCVVFGRIAGHESVKHLLGNNVRMRSFAEAMEIDGERVKDHAPELSAKVATSHEYTLEEVKEHNTKSDCWIVVHNKVYNVSEFLNDHPGGALSILAYAGKDATAEFDMVHPPGVMDRYASDMVIGSLRKGPPLESGVHLPTLAWCPCCRRPVTCIDIDGDASRAQCDACDIEVSVRRRHKS
jgi:cytochrome b involved in lipid metabolism